jgi:hypothetical protein
MQNENDTPKPDTAQQPADEGLDETACSTFSITASTDDGYWRKNGQRIILNTIRYKKRMTTAQAVALIGKHGASTLLALEKAGRIRRIKRGLYAEI